MKPIEPSIALRTEIIATCDLLRFDQLDPVRFCHESEQFRAAFASAVEFDDAIGTLADAYDPSWYGRTPIPADRAPAAIYRLHIAAHVARTRTFEPLYDCLPSWPEAARVVLLAHARACVKRCVLWPGQGPLPFPLTGTGDAIAHLAAFLSEEMPVAA